LLDTGEALPMVCLVPPPRPVLPIDVLVAGGGERGARRQDVAASEGEGRTCQPRQRVGCPAGEKGNVDVCLCVFHMSMMVVVPLFGERWWRGSKQLLHM